MYIRISKKYYQSKIIKLFQSLILLLLEFEPGPSVIQIQHSIELKEMSCCKYCIYTHNQ